jgi:hypothetical protein
MSGLVNPVCAVLYTRMPCEPCEIAFWLCYKGLTFDCRASDVASCMEIPIEELEPASGRHEDYFAFPQILDSHHIMQLMSVSKAEDSRIGM